MNHHLTIAVIGAGPSGLFIFKHLIEANIPGLHIDFFEKSNIAGAGMPYSKQGAGLEHITNVSSNEIPELETSIAEWIQTVDRNVLKHYNIDPEKFNEYKVMPRLLFGNYLADQFKLLQKKAKTKGIVFHIYFNTEVEDICENSSEKKIDIIAADFRQSYDRIIICSGHRWPLKREKNIAGYFDSPYPPSKLLFHVNHPVAIKGSSLTAIDALRTLSRQHGHYTENEEGKLRYSLNNNYADFRLIMHSSNGMLPAVRFHLDDTSLASHSMLRNEEIEENKKRNDGFLSLDYVFETNFKELLKAREPDFYEKISDMKMEDFVKMIMDTREKIDAFELLKKEYEAAEKSIKWQRSIYWKEMLAVLSFTMNYPAKYFSAEDYLRLQKILMPLISLVIAFLPQGSAQEIMALHDAGILSLIEVGEDSSVEVNKEGEITYHYTDRFGDKHETQYKTFIDCTGQPHLDYEDFPYKSLQQQKIVSPARFKFRDASIAENMLRNRIECISKDEQGNYYLRVSGVAINDYFQVLDNYNALNENIFVMAVPLIGGYNPDYSGLDFCETAARIIVDHIKTQSPVAENS